MEQARKHLGVQVQLGSMERNILLTELSLQDVTLRDLKGSGESITVSRLAVSIDPYAFFRGKLVIRDLRLEGLSLQVVRTKDGGVSVEPLFPFWQKRSSGNKAFPLGFEIGNVALMNVDLSYRDIPADLRVRLQGVVIVLSQDRFDPPDRRRVNLKAGKGQVGWRVFPAGREVAINALSGRFFMTSEEIVVSRMTIDTVPLSMEVSGNIPLKKGIELTGDLNLDLNLDRLPWLLVDSSGRLSLRGRVGGDLAVPSFRGQLSATGMRLAGREFQKVSADLLLRPDGGTLENSRIVYRDEEVRADLKVGFRQGLPFEGRVEMERFPLSKLLQEVRGTPNLPEGEVRATAMMAGQLSGGATSLTMDGGIRLPLGDGTPRDFDFTLSGSYAEGGLHDLAFIGSSGSLTATLGGSLSAAGPRGALSIVEEDLGQWKEIKGLQGLEGSLTLEGNIGGAWEDIRSKVDLEVHQPAREPYRLDLIQAHLDLDRKGIALPMLTLKAGSSVLVGQAFLPWDPERSHPWLDLTLADGDVRELLAAAGLDLEVWGRAKGDLEVRYDRAGVVGVGRLNLRSGRIMEETFDEIDLAGSYSGGGFSAERIVITKEGRRLEGSGTLEGGAYEVQVRTREPLFLESVRYLQKIRVPLAGEVNLSGKAKGTLDGKVIKARADLDWEQISYEGRTWRGGKGVFLFDGPDLEAEGELLNGTLRTDLRVDLRGDLPFSGTISTPGTINRMDINEFLGIGIPGNLVTGNIRVRADARGVLTNVNRTKVDGVITEADFTINGIRFLSEEEVPFHYFPETGIQFVRLPLRSGGSVIDGSLRIAPDAGIEGSVNGNVDLQGLAFLKPTVDSFSGQASIQLKVTGRLAEPALNGSIVLLGAQCTAHVPFDLPVKGLKGKIEVVGSRLHIGEIQGEPEGGRLWMSGEVFFTGFKPTRGSLQWKGEGVPVNFPEGLHTVNRAAIGLKFVEGRGFLRGTVTMDEGTFNREVDIENLIALIGERAVGETPPDQEETAGNGGRWLNLDVEMVTASPLTVEMKLVRGQASGNLHLRGTASAPVLTGRLEMSEGSIEYRGHVFEVTNGTVRFVHPRRIEPSFDFSGRTQVTGFDRDGVVTDYTVDLRAEGVPQKFKLDLVSSPTLSEVDIVSLLTWGAVGEQVFASRGGLSAAEATLLLTRELKGKLESEVERVTGFDRFAINPSTVSSSGERTTRIQVDKKLSDKFYLTYSTPVLANEEQEVLVKYRVSRAFSLIGEQRGEADFGLDLDFQFEIP